MSKKFDIKTAIFQNLYFLFIQIEFPKVLEQKLLAIAWLLRALVV